MRIGSKPDTLKTRILFPRGQGRARFTREGVRGDELYTFDGDAGQILHASITSPDDGFFLAVMNEADGEFLTEPGNEQEWSGELPMTSSYHVLIFPSLDSRAYTLDVSLNDAVRAKAA